VSAKPHTGPELVVRDLVISMTLRAFGLHLHGALVERHEFKHLRGGDPADAALSPGSSPIIEPRSPFVAFRLIGHVIVVNRHKVTDS
jgi:hypothetical protein